MTGGAQDPEGRESRAVRETRTALEQRGPQSRDINDLATSDLPLIGWSGGPLHPQYVAQALARVESGEVEYLAVRSPCGLPVSIGGIDYAKEPHAGNLWQLSTHGELRSMGLGSRLMGVAEQRVRARGLSDVVLGVEEANVRARSLYDRLGYVAYGREQDYWYEADDEGIPRRRRAQITLMRKTLS